MVELIDFVEYSDKREVKEEEFFKRVVYKDYMNEGKIAKMLSKKMYIYAIIYLESEII